MKDSDSEWEAKRKELIDQFLKGLRQLKLEKKYRTSYRKIFLFLNC